MRLIANDVSNIFGTVAPPVSTVPTEASSAIGSLISLGLKIFIFIAAVALLIYLLLGAFEWIISGGEKEKLSKAQGKITNALIGIIVIILVLSVFCLVTQNILGWGSCFEFPLPNL